ncbi:MAG: class I adenylate-forming enzyme family protein, partial [Pseudomonadota bacterium]
MTNVQYFRPPDDGQDFPFGNRALLGDILHMAANAHEERAFLHVVADQKTYSYRDMDTLANRVAHGCREQIASKPKYCAIMLENSAEYLAISYGLKKADIVEVSINRAFRGPSLARMIALTKTKILFTSAVHLQALYDVRGDIPDIAVLVIIGDTTKARTLFADRTIMAFDDFLSDKDHHMQSQACDTDTQAVLFTSGTTGVSKGCMLSHRYAARTAQYCLAPFRIRRDDCIYSPYPLSHIGPAYYDILPAMMVGAQVVLRDGFSLSNFWQEVTQYDVTFFMMLGSVQQLLWAAP